MKTIYRLSQGCSIYLSTIYKIKVIPIRNDHLYNLIFDDWVVYLKNELETNFIKSEYLATKFKDLELEKGKIMLLSKKLGLD